MLEKAVLESTIFYNFSRLYNQLNSANTLQQQQHQTLEPVQNKQQSTLKEDIMVS